jgi:two-component system, OmpR family, sensor histidine kinase BaeS
MRLRLVHTLSLLLLVAVLLAVLAMGAVTAWNLKNGFVNYLAARDVERLTQFAAMVGKAAEQSGGMAALQQRPRPMHNLLEQFAQEQGLPMRQGPSPPTLDAGPNTTDGRPGYGRPPPPGDDSFGARLAVVTLDGQALIGRRPPLQTGPFIDRPIKVHGSVVALARLRPAPPVTDADDARFLQTQYRDIVWVAATLFLLALVSAWWVARRWSQPLRAVQEATGRIARGEFDVRVAMTLRGSGRSDEIGDVVRNINQMADSLQRLDSGRRRWVANVSHELRTPLAVLRGEIEALIDGVRPLRPAAILSLRDETLRLAALVDDLHLLAMSDLQALPCQFTDIDAASLVEQIFQRFAPRASSAGLSLSGQVDAPRPLNVRWDGTRIQQLLVNLLENSLRYTDAPGHIVWSVKSDGDRVVIDINDSAPGVPVATLPHVFEPLYRVDAARSRQHGGSGLGLAICEAIVRSHGGHIQAGLSALGGLHVGVELPASPPPSQGTSS